MTPFPCRLARALPALALAALAAAPLAHAGDQDSERERLARIASELSQVQTLVSQAALDSPPAQRVNFRYDWLQRDIEMMREGIERHLDAPRQPRPAPPLRGDYRE